MKINFGNMKNYNQAIERKLHSIEQSLPNDLQPNAAFSFINDLAKDNDIHLQSLNVVENISDRLTIQIESLGDFFSLQNFLNDVKNSGRTVTIQISEFNDGELYRDDQLEFIRYSKINANFLKFTESDEILLEE